MHKKKTLKEVDPMDLAYFAGFFDGEGCINISRSIRVTGKSKSPVYSLQIVVSQNDKDAMEFWRDTFGVGSVHIKKVDLEKRNNGYDLHITSWEAVALLKVILPYLRLKKEQAKIAIEFQENMSLCHNQYSLTPEILNERDRLYQRLKDMKGKSSKSRGRPGKGDAVARNLILGLNARKWAAKVARVHTNRAVHNKRKYQGMDRLV